jgi:hypothetical protein
MCEALRRSEDAVTAHEAVLRAFRYFTRITADEQAVVRKILERAVREVPNHANSLLSSPRESHPEALPELYVSLSTHTAPMVDFLLTTTAFDRSSGRWFGASPARRIPGTYPRRLHSYRKSSRLSPTRFAHGAPRRRISRRAAPVAAQLRSRLVQNGDHCLLLRLPLRLHRTEHG